MTTQTIRQPLRDDENLEKLLEEIAEANPDADSVGTLVSQGEEHDLIMVEGVDTESVELPEEAHGFEISRLERSIPEDEETFEELVEEYDWEKKDFETPIDPAWIRFEEADDAEE